MPKTIVFCADGTWNKPADVRGTEPADPGASKGDGSQGVLKLFKRLAKELTGDHDAPKSGNITNVLKLFDNLTGALTAASKDDPKEREKFAFDDDGRMTQAAKYIHGVGTSPDPVLSAIGGAFGAGLITRIIRGFTFISRHYEEGDDIHVVGFSRGAYTARALGDMIVKVGLLNPSSYDPEDKAAAYRLGIAAWCRAKNMTLATKSGFLQKIVDLGGKIGGTMIEDRHLIAKVKVKSVAVWDTVGSMGIPRYEGEEDERLDILQFGSNELSPDVESGFHAMAIDEVRRDFPVACWEERQGVEQVWFAGAHSDVGGGYGADTDCKLLSDIPLGWMMSKLRSKGVAFQAPLPHRLDGGTKDAICHNSREKPPFSLIDAVGRKAAKHHRFHESVRASWKNAPSWRPTSFTGLDLDRLEWDRGSYA
jgi:glutathione S-transferase